MSKEKLISADSVLFMQCRSVKKCNIVLEYIRNFDASFNIVNNYVGEEGYDFVLIGYNGYEFESSSFGVVGDCSAVASEVRGLGIEYGFGELSDFVRDAKTLLGLLPKKSLRLSNRDKTIIKVGRDGLIDIGCQTYKISKIKTLIESLDNIGFEELRVENIVFTYTDMLAIKELIESNENES